MLLSHVNYIIDSILHLIVKLMISCLSVNMMFSEIFVFGTFICEYFFQWWLNLLIMIWFWGFFLVNMSLFLKSARVKCLLKNKYIKCFLHFLMCAILVFLKGYPCSWGQGTIFTLTSMNGKKRKETSKIIAYWKVGS